MTSGHMIKHPRMGATVKNCVEQIPAISLASSIQPITRTVLRVRLTIKPEFQWNDKVHGSTSEPWWIWVEDPDNNHIYHSEYFLLHKKQVCTSLHRFALVHLCLLGLLRKLDQFWRGRHVKNIAKRFQEFKMTAGGLNAPGSIFQVFARYFLVTYVDKSTYPLSFFLSRF